MDGKVALEGATLVDRKAKVHLFHIPLILYRCGTSHLNI